jgi:hypothetical protein
MVFGSRNSNHAIPTNRQTDEQTNRQLGLLHMYALTSWIDLGQKLLNEYCFGFVSHFTIARGIVAGVWKLKAARRIKAYAVRFPGLSRRIKKNVNN